MGWVNKDCIEYLLERNYPVELVLVNPNSDMNYYRKILSLRGNIKASVNNSINSFKTTYDTFITMKNKLTKLYLINNNTKLSDLILFTGTNLIDNNDNLLSLNDIDKNKLKKIEIDATPL